MKSMSVRGVHISTEEGCIVRIAEMLIAEEMRFVREELEKLRSDLALTSAIQRQELQTFYEDAMLIIKRNEHEF